MVSPDISVGIHSLGDLSRFEYAPVHVKQENAFSYPKASIRACALKLGLDNAKR